MHTKSSNIQGCTTRFQKLQSQSHISRQHFHSGLAPVLRYELRWSPTHRQWKVSVSGSRTRGSTRSEPRAGERRRGRGILAPSFTNENLPSRAWIHSTDRPSDRCPWRLLNVWTAPLAPLRFAGGRRLLVPPRRPE